MHRFITSISTRGYFTYAKECILSLDRNLPEGELIIIVDEPLPPYEDLSERCKWGVASGPSMRFYNSLFQWPIFQGNIQGGYDYRRNLSAWTRKVVAQMSAAEGYAGRLFWFDSDASLDKPIPGAWMDAAIDGHAVCYMGREKWHACTSFIGWDMLHEDAPKFWQPYTGLYESGEVLLLQQWDDAFVAEYIIKQLNVSANNLSAGILEQGPWNVFEHVFHGFGGRHLKGNLKFKSPEVQSQGPQRYQQLIDIAARLRPSTMLEIGVWRGDRAIDIANACKNPLHYIGVDVFDSGSNELDKVEKNVKSPMSKVDVRARLSSGAGIKSIALYEGLSRDMLPKVMQDFGANSMDLIFIDGGHSRETIATDMSYARQLLAPGGIIVLDDYYTGMPEEELAKFGCQSVLEPGSFELLPIKDAVQGGGLVQMAVIKA